MDPRTLSKLAEHAPSPCFHTYRMGITTLGSLNFKLHSESLSLLSETHGKSRGNSGSICRNWRGREKRRVCKTRIDGGPENSERFLLAVGSGTNENSYKKPGSTGQWRFKWLGKEKMKADTKTGGSSATEHQFSGVSSVCPTARRRHTKRSGRKMTHLRTKGQFIIRLRNKREVNQGNMLEKWWLRSHWGRLRDILAVIPMTRIKEYVKCFQIGQIYYFGKK